uniref:Protein YOP1 n=1 Tax=Lankesteria abbotti TaxID=340204 RepID=A0A6T5UIG5_9APIC|mmetsp:Transcript_444/g.404  ORF Transcript_444/g.404 Transcript_444/m.404 type:complete len:165 (+) Transcript_444:51-545(+)|eukprot:CAMPEP_0113845572 /NCGR_PEP_ID=MMETSP0372-20130328/831_1 /TAXON_ID=340204 /ORGANISM="Lankesteria abbotti" /LENGTH=164 /DNA_ID=CAMNT_0000814629 /DNA_START=63 /DNA_END=557 /DNA_ORIENTATION=+ /assembly_acc=CAM_ASM_000359
MAISIVPFLGFLSFLTQIVYPLVVSIKTLFDREAQFPEVAQWCLYWIIYSLWNFLQTNVFFIFVEYIPLFLEAKFVVFLWLVYPEFKGAGWLWFNLLEQPYQVVDNKISDQVDTKLQAVLNFVSSQTSSEGKGSVEQLRPSSVGTPMKPTAVDTTETKSSVMAS